jgi:hypothetical protein
MKPLVVEAVVTALAWSVGVYSLLKFSFGAFAALGVR